MAVHQLKDKRWIVQYRDKETGKLKREYFGKEPGSETKAFERNRELNLREYKRVVEGHSAFFVDLVNAYAQGKVGIIQESTLTNFMWKMDGVILPELGHIRAMNLTPKRMDQYVNKRLKSKSKKKEPIKRTTVHRELSDIKAVLNWAARRRYIAFNPLVNYEMPKRDDAIIIPPSSDEIKSILKHSPDRLLRAISLSYYTGLRPGQRELYSLKWSDVDFEAGTIMVTSAKKGGQFKYRMVPIHPDFVEVLSQWRVQDENLDGPIIHYRKKPVKSLKKIFNQVKEKAGIKRRLTMYSFRHAFATLLLKHNADLKSTSEILGHSRTDTTTRIYQHVDFEMHKEAVKRLPAIDLNIQKSITKDITRKSANSRD